MRLLTVFVIGLSIGWVVEWLIDVFFFRASETEVMSAEAAERRLNALRAELSAVRDQRDEALAQLAELRSARTEFVTSHQPPEEDDLTTVDGIGPKISSILNQAGITTYADLAATDVRELRRILERAGKRYRLADPGTWPEQARLAATGAWGALRDLQSTLTRERRANS